MQPEAREYLPLAKLSMTFAVLAPFTLFLLAIPAIICGHDALAELKRRPTFCGKDRAITAIVLGYAEILFAVFSVISLMNGIAHAVSKTG